MRINPLHACDFYKTGHKFQYPKGTSMVYSNFTPRSAKLSPIPKDLFDGVVFFGLQYFIKDFLEDAWLDEFFVRDKKDVVTEYKHRMDTSLGKDSIPVEHIEALHDLGYLPIKIKALPEGSIVPIGVPCLVIYNTHPDFYWLTNYLETALSCYLWKPMTSATIARAYRKLLEKYAEKTGVGLGFVDIQAHDFSCRGMSGIQDAALSGAAHLTSFCGTDTIAAIDLLEYYYSNNETGMIGCSVPATEHSVMCMGTKEAEIDTFRRLITETYPKGILSIVSDTWDFWKVIGQYAFTLKDEITSRDGRVVFRPDSGDPVKIICGDDAWAGASIEELKGAVEMLWDIFGGTITDKGYKLLDSHVGLIYGDSITLERAAQILEGLEKKGFASGNIVFGVGSYTYNYTTRDSFGFAVKSTYGEVEGIGREIFKDPVTDNGVKKSARGLLRVENNDGIYSLHDQQASIDSEGCALETVYWNGTVVKSHTIQDIRKRARK